MFSPGQSKTALNWTEKGHKERLAATGTFSAFTVVTMYMHVSKLVKLYAGNVQGFLVFQLYLIKDVITFSHEIYKN